MKSEKNTRVDSPPFYACGYKCKLQVQPNGLKTGKHTHLSIYIGIIKGENDAFFTWLSRKRWRLRWLINKKMQTTGRTLLCPSFYSISLNPLRSLWIMKTLSGAFLNLYPTKTYWKGATMWAMLFFFRFASRHQYDYDFQNRIRTF